MHLKTHKLYGKGSFAKWANDEGKAFGPKEIGNVSHEYKEAHEWSGYLVGMDVALAPITVVIAKAPTTSTDDFGVVNVDGGPADKAYTVTLTIRDAASGGDDVQNISIPQGATAPTAAAMIAAAVSDPNVRVTAMYHQWGSTAIDITFTPKPGSHIAKLEISIA